MKISLSVIWVNSRNAFGNRCIKREGKSPLFYFVVYFLFFTNYEYLIDNEYSEYCELLVINGLSKEPIVPNSIIIKYAEESGHTVKYVEEIWEEAKKEADAKFEIKKDSDRDEHYWAYVNHVTQVRLGLKKNKPKKKDKS